MTDIFLKTMTLALILSSCTDESSVKRYADAEGWDSYEITGFRLFACSEDDFYHTGFKATKNGRCFSGVVCRGLLFRGSTLRLD